MRKRNRKILMFKKIAVVLAAVVLIVSATIGGTLAWLTDQTTKVENVFTPSTINIDLDETTGAEYKMVPGADIKKDPKVTVESGSEACWVFVKIIETGSVTVKITNADNATETKTYYFDDFLTYAIASGWTTLSETDADGDNTNDTIVIYRHQAATDSNVSYSILEDDEVSVKNTVTKKMMDAIGEESNLKPTLTFTAYAIQSENLTETEMYKIWDLASKQS